MPHASVASVPSAVLHSTSPFFCNHSSYYYLSSVNLTLPLMIWQFSFVTVFLVTTGSRLHWGCRPVGGRDEGLGSFRGAAGDLPLSVLSWQQHSWNCREALAGFSSVHPLLALGVTILTWLCSRRWRWAQPMVEAQPGKSTAVSLPVTETSSSVQFATFSSLFNQVTVSSFDLLCLTKNSHMEDLPLFKSARRCLCTGKRRHPGGFSSR